MITDRATRPLHHRRRRLTELVSARCGSDDPAHDGQVHEACRQRRLALRWPFFCDRNGRVAKLVARAQPVHEA
ncbi:MAG: hypothetical protein AAFX85_15105, partial [Pseudomonadota bacterium]